MAFDLDEDELRATRKMNKADRNEIEVNEYVRTKEGLIEKIKEFIPHYTKGKREGQEVEENFLLMGKEQCKFIESIDYRIPPCYPSDEEWEKIKKYIVKHSKNLIALIEIKDLVCFKNKLQNSLENEEMIIHIFDNDTLEEVKQAIEKGEIELLEILTHEQFKKSSYKVGGEDER